MKNLTLAHIASACNGTYIGEEYKQNCYVSSIVTDSRKVEKDTLFIPIRGERVDAHDYIPAVMKAGALCTLSEKDLPGADYPYIRVTSSLQAIKDIAKYYLHQLAIPVVGITGSVGKTSTKEVIAAVLSQKYRVHKTQGNFNNELGLPLTIFGLREEHQIAVLEMGISDFGEMHRLADIARPDTCVITNIGCCHLEFLKTRDGIRKAKTEIFDYLKEDGHIILNGDDDKLCTIKEVKGIRPIFFGLHKDKAVYAEEMKSLGLKGMACNIHVGTASFAVTIPIPGEHMVYNALAATAVGMVYGLTVEEIKQGIESLQSLSGRFHIIEANGCTIVDDCYNANPVSMKASLSLLQEGLGRKVAILGDMGELGADEVKLHEEVGHYMAGLSVDLCICVGNLCNYLAEAAKQDNPDLEVVVTKDMESLLERLPELIKEGDTILVKASHFMKFEKIVKRLQEKIS